MVTLDRPAPRAVTRPRDPILTPGRTALLLGALGVGYRLVMLLVGVPAANSDEAVTGLVAQHIAEGRHLPLFFYGQYYMGALESYLAAPLFALVGSGTLALRLPNLLLYALFLALMWQLVRRLYHPWFATAVIGLLAVGSDRILKNQLIAGGGYPEMNPAAALLLLLAVLLGLGAVRHRVPAFAAFGLVAGLTLWDDWLVLPYVAAAGTLLLTVTGRELLGRCGAALTAGVAVGLVPIVAHNLTAAPHQRSLAVYRQLGGGPPADWADRLHGGVLFGLPMGTGFCSPSHCAPWQLWWGVVAPLLLVAAGLLALRALRHARRVQPGHAAGRTVHLGSRPGHAAGGAVHLDGRVIHGVDQPGHVAGWAAGDPARREVIRQGGRLALVVAAAISVAAYAGSSAAGTTPVESARYLSCLLVSLPALLWPLWRAARTWRPQPAGWWSRRPTWSPGVLCWAARGVLLAVVASVLVATGTLVATVDQATRADQRRQALVGALDRLGVRHFYTDYWTCYPIVFTTRERLACGVIREDLRAGWNRYPDYPARVARADRVAYVLPAGSPLDRTVSDWLAATGTPVTRTTVPGYVIHLPAARVGLPLR